MDGDSVLVSMQLLPVSLLYSICWICISYYGLMEVRSCMLGWNFFPIYNSSWTGITLLSIHHCVYYSIFHAVGWLPRNITIYLRSTRTDLFVYSRVCSIQSMIMMLLHLAPVVSLLSDCCVFHSWVWDELVHGKLGLIWCIIHCIQSYLVLSFLWCREEHIWELVSASIVAQIFVVYQAEALSLPIISYLILFGYRVDYKLVVVESRLTSSLYSLFIVFQISSRSSMFGLYCHW